MISIAYGSDSSTPQTIMDPMRQMLEIVQQVVEDNKAERCGGVTSTLQQEENFPSGKP